MRNTHLSFLEHPSPRASQAYTSLPASEDQLFSDPRITQTQRDGGFTLTDNAAADTWLGLIKMNEPMPDHHQVFVQPDTESPGQDNMIYVQTASPAGGDTEAAFMTQARAIRNPQLVTDEDRPLYNHIEAVYSEHL